MSCSILIPLIGPAIGGFIAGTIGFIVAWWKWRRDGRNQFLAVIAEVEADMDERIDGIREVHISSLPRVRSAVFAVQPFVCCCRFDRIMKVWQAYKKPDPEQLDWGLSMSRQAVHEAMSPGAPNPNVRADDWMRARLKEFRKSVG
jgi:hypothetical protein